MPCAAGELCLWQDSTPKEPDGHTCRGGCGGRLHGNCGDVDQEGDTEMQRIYPTCVAVNQSSQATIGKCKLGSAASGKGGPGGAKKAASKSRGRAVPPPFTELSSHFCALESVAEKCGMKEAAYHLQKAKMAMIHTQASRPARQTDIGAFTAVTERDDGERGVSGSVS